MPACRILLVVLSASFATAQPIVQNTVVRSFTPVAGNPWVADIWGYTDALGRDFALVCQGDLGLSIYEVTNPVSPVFAGMIPATASDLKDVKTIPGWAFCVQQTGSVLVVDLSDPYAPTVATSFSGSGHNCFLRDGYFYYARQGGSPNGLEIWDVANPAAPVFQSLYDPPGFDCHDVYVEDDVAYAHRSFGGGAGCYILDVSNKMSPVFLNSFPHGSIAHSSWMYHPPGGRKVLLANNETAGGRCRLFDVTDPANPTYLSEYVTDPAITIHNVVVAGRYAFFAYYADYLRIVDVANPSAPVEVGVYDPAPVNPTTSIYGGSWGVALLSDTRVLLTESFTAVKGFWVIDFTPPAAPSLSLATQGLGDLALQVAGADPMGEIFLGVSLLTAAPIGAGPLVGLGADAAFVVALPLGTPPFHVLADAGGSYVFGVPAGIPIGLTADFRGVAATLGQAALTELGRVTF